MHKDWTRSGCASVKLMAAGPEESCATGTIPPFGRSRDTHQTVTLDIIRRPKTTPIHELERYMRCRDCSQLRGCAYKRGHLIALRPTKISADDPPSTWWPGERD
jgi:hypothetical protein